MTEVTMANTMESAYSPAGGRNLKPLNLRTYREPQPAGLKSKKMLYIAAPIAVGLLAWKFKRLRPILSSLAVSGLGWYTNQWRLARQHERDPRIDQAGDESFPASDPPAYGR
jgi:hypothetical protein